jgi:hypothetical protein
MSTAVLFFVMYYAGGVTTLLLNEVDDPTGDGLSVANVAGAVAWPVTAASLIITKVNEYRKGL